MHHQLDKTGSLYSNFAVVSVVPRGYVDPKIFPDRISWSIVGDGVDIFFEHIHCLGNKLQSSGNKVPNQADIHIGR